MSREGKMLLILGLALGIGIGASGMWLYLMSKHAGRPVQWQVILLSSALTFAVIGALMAQHG